MWLTRLSLRRPVTLAMAIASVVVLGAVSVLKLPLDFLPRVEFPFIAVYVPYQGGIPAENEREIVRPLEEVLATLGGVKEISSFSDAGEVQVGVTFDWGRDVNLLRLEVKEKIDQIRDRLPADIPQIFLLTFNTSDIPDHRGAHLGARARPVRELGPDRPEDHRAAAAHPGRRAREHRRRAAHPGLGLPATGQDPRAPGRPRPAVPRPRGGQRRADGGARHRPGPALRRAYHQRARRVPRTWPSCRWTRAGCGWATWPRWSTARRRCRYGRVLNGEPAIAFWVQKASGANTVAVCRAIEAELERINHDPALQGINSFAFFNQADQITDSLRSLLQGGLSGSLLAVAILFLFLRRVSMTLVVSVAIPLSVIGTCVFMYLSGRSLNVLTMMGLMLGVGMLVDNAVVVLESIHRRQLEGARPLSAVVRGTREVGMAITASTLTTVIVFAPVVISRADELSVWLGEVGVTISVTLILSLLVSLTVVPLLALRGSRTAMPAPEPRWLLWLQERYRRTLTWTAIRHPLLTSLVLVPAVLRGHVRGHEADRASSPDVEGQGGMRRENLRVQFHYTGPVDKEASRVARGARLGVAGDTPRRTGPARHLFVLCGRRRRHHAVLPGRRGHREVLPAGARRPARAPARAGRRGVPLRRRAGAGRRRQDVLGDHQRRRDRVAARSTRARPGAGWRWSRASATCAATTRRAVPRCRSAWTRCSRGGSASRPGPCRASWG